MTDQQPGWINHLVEPLHVKPGSAVSLPRDFDPGARFGVRKKGDGQDLLRQGVELLAEYQDRLAAQDTYGVLVVLQALDAERLPPESRTGDTWERRYREINDWERYLADQGIRVIKIFLNVSREEQRRRFLRRIDQPGKNWKFSASDVRERRYWDDYQRAYSEMLSHTSTRWAPWYVLPADHKWFTRLCAAAVIAQTLIDIDPHYPPPDPAARRELEQARRELEAEAR